MEFTEISDVLEAKGIENIHVEESNIITNPQEFLDAIEEMKFKRIRINVDGILLCDYNFAVEMVSRGVRIFQVKFMHIIPKKHDEFAGPGSFKLLMKAIAEVNCVSVDLDIPIIFQFILDFDEPEYLVDAVEELSALYPSQFKIEGEHAQKAIDLAISKGIWAE